MHVCSSPCSVGEPVPVLPPTPDDKESDTMKTYQSTLDTDRTGMGGNIQQPTLDVSGFTLQATLESLTKTFDHLKKAVVSM